MRLIIKHIELWLSGLGLLLILLVPMLLAPGSERSWELTAITAICVGVLHGIIFWLIRRRQRHIRREAIVDIRGMLKDVVNNELQIALWNFPHPARDADEAHRLDRASRALERVSAAMETLSEESLRSWKRRYADIA